MNNTIIEFNKRQQKDDIPEIRPGMKIRVHERIKEGDKERIQVFEGIVLAIKHGKNLPATMTVRAVIAGVGVEKIWPIHSPKISKIEIVRASKVRRAKLYFLRNLSPKKIKRKLSVFKEVISPIVEPKIEVETEEVKDESLTADDDVADNTVEKSEDVVENNSDEESKNDNGEELKVDDAEISEDEKEGDGNGDNASDDVVEKENAEAEKEEVVAEKEDVEVENDNDNDNDNDKKEDDKEKESELK